MRRHLTPTQMAVACNFGGKNYCDDALAGSIQSLTKTAIERATEFNEMPSGEEEPAKIHCDNNGRAHSADFATADFLTEERRLNRLM